MRHATCTACWSRSCCSVFVSQLLKEASVEEILAVTERAVAVFMAAYGHGIPPTDRGIEFGSGLAMPVSVGIYRPQGGNS